MENDLKMAALDEARQAEIVYLKKLNRWIALVACPGLLFYAVWHYTLGNFFQAGIYSLMVGNTILALLVGLYLKDLDRLILNRRVTTAIDFGLLAVSLLTGLFSDYLYIFLPWLFLYPVAVIIFFSRKIGISIALVFSIAAGAILLILDLPPMNSGNVKILKINSINALASLLTISIIYERIRARMQDDLAHSQEEYRIAEQQQRETNKELQKEIELRVQSEAALAQSEIHYRTLFVESSMPLWEEDWSKVKSHLDGLPREARNDLSSYFKTDPGTVEKCISLTRVIEVNNATLKLFSADTKATLFQNLIPLMTPDVMAYLGRRLASLYETGRHDAEIASTTMDGKPMHLLISSILPSGYETSWKKVFTSMYNITERIAMEEEKKRIDLQFQNVRQIQAIATLAGGIAHQFNNALSVIFGSLDMMEYKTKGDSENSSFLNSLKTSATKMKRLTDQLLAYARGGKYKPKQFSVNDLVSAIINSGSIIRNSSVPVITDLAADLYPINGDFTQIKMVLEAVLSNAFEAVGKNGEVRITTYNKNIEEELTDAGQRLPRGSYCVIRITDNGVGMKEETVQHIFEPFFTTKFHGRGLGMAAAYGIVKNHDGMITVESELNKGTSVMICLPGSGGIQDANTSA